MRILFTHSPRSHILRFMKTYSIFEHDVNALTMSKFFTNGKVITDCSFLRPELTDGDTRKVVPGRMVATDDGRVVFTPYKSGNQPRYATIAETRHGAVKRYANSTVISFRFSNELQLLTMLKHMTEEVGELAVRVYHKLTK